MGECLCLLSFSLQCPNLRNQMACSSKKISWSAWTRTVEWKSLLDVNKVGELFPSHYRRCTFLVTEIHYVLQSSFSFSNNLVKKQINFWPTEPNSPNYIPSLSSLTPPPPSALLGLPSIALLCRNSPHRYYIKLFLHGLRFSLLEI